MVKKIKGQIKKNMVNYREDALKNSWDNIAKNLNKILKQ